MGSAASPRSPRKAVRTIRYPPAPDFKWVNTTLGNLKNTLRYHAIRPKHVPRYLAAFQYRYNRRYRLADMIEALGRDALRAACIGS